jgi:hypothetical protein
MEKGAKHRGSLNWYRLQIRARQAFNRIPLKDEQKIYILTLLTGAACGLAAVLFHLLLARLVPGTFDLSSGSRSPLVAISACRAVAWCGWPDCRGRSLLLCVIC